MVRLPVDPKNPRTASQLSEALLVRDSLQPFCTAAATKFHAPQASTFLLKKQNPYSEIEQPCIQKTALPVRWSSDHRQNPHPGI